MSGDTDATPIQTPGDAQLLASGDPIEIDVEGDIERATVTLCADGVALTASLFPEDIERVQADLDAAAAGIDPEAAEQAQAVIETVKGSPTDTE